MLRMVFGLVCGQRTHSISGGDKEHITYISMQMLSTHVTSKAKCDILVNIILIRTKYTF